MANTASELARKVCGCGSCRQPEIGFTPLPCERATVIEQVLTTAQDEARREEREAAAVLVELSDLFWHEGDPRKRIAAAIRRRT